MNKKPIEIKKASDITPALVRRILKVVDRGLCRGLGINGEMCVEQAINYALNDESQRDKPRCVAKPIITAKVRLNDARWSSDQARAKGMRRLAIAQLGTAGKERFEKGRFNVEYCVEVAREFTGDKSIKTARKARQELGLLFLKTGGKTPSIHECGGPGSRYSVADNVDGSYNVKDDDRLNRIAECCLRVLKRMRAPGCKYLPK